jgi:hypothetical protein
MIKHPIPTHLSDPEDYFYSILCSSIFILYWIWEIKKRLFMDSGDSGYQQLKQ